MKKVNKKHMKKLFVGLGATATIVAPIASSVSFAAKAVNPSLVAWQNFYKQINDITKDQEAIVNWSQELKLKLTNSSFYKEQIAGGKWNITNGDDMYGVLHALQQSKEFTDLEKVVIGKRVVGNQMSSDLFENYGFGGLQTTSNAIVAAQGILSDISKQNKPFQLNGQTVNLVGATGDNISYDVTHFNQHEFNFSNQDILNYYLAAVVQSIEFKTLTTDFAKSLSGYVGSTLTFKQAISNFYADAREFLNKISSDKLPVATLLNMSVFQMFTPIDIDNTTSDDEAYELFMKSPLARTMYPNGVNEDKLSTYREETELELKRTYASAELVQLNSLLTGLKKINSPFLSKIVNNSADESKPFADAEAVESALSFAKLLADYSNSFRNDVQVMVDNDPINGYAIYIKTGHNFGAWTILQDDKFKIPYFVMGDSNWDVSYGFKSYSNTSMNPGNFKLTVVSDKTQTIQLAIGSELLKVESGKVVPTGFARGFDMNVQLKFNGTLYSPNGLWAYESSWNNNNSVKHENWNVGFNDISWTSAQNNPISDVKMNFFYDDSLAAPQSSKTFRELQDKLNIAIASITKQVINQTKGIGSTFTFDPLASYSFTINLDSVNFGKTYYDNFDDAGIGNTHVDNVRFTNVDANFSYKITEMKN